MINCCWDEHFCYSCRGVGRSKPGNGKDILIFFLEGKLLRKIKKSSPGSELGKLFLINWNFFMRKSLLQFCFDSKLYNSKIFKRCILHWGRIAWRKWARTINAWHNFTNRSRSWFRISMYLDTKHTHTICMQTFINLSIPIHQRGEILCFPFVRVESQARRKIDILVAHRLDCSMLNMLCNDWRERKT